VHKDNMRQIQTYIRPHFDIHIYVSHKENTVQTVILSHKKN